MRFVEVEISKWSDFSAFAENSFGFVFRGQASVDWELETSLERFSNRVSSMPWHEVGERWALDEFISKYHLYSSSSPAPGDFFEWLALLQHHGCPTRLLDFSSSIYVALHFAIHDVNGSSAIWCLNRLAVRGSLFEKFSLPYIKGDTLKDSVNVHHKNLINSMICRADCAPDVFPHLVPLESVRASFRLARQQGLFMAPTVFSMDDTAVFQRSLLNSLGREGEDSINFDQVDVSGLLSDVRLADSVGCIKIIITEGLKRSSVKQLSYMGINDEVLFPDLDGLARSLAMKHLWL